MRINTFISALAQVSFEHFQYQCHCYKQVSLPIPKQYFYHYLHLKNITHVLSIL